MKSKSNLQKISIQAFLTLFVMAISLPMPYANGLSPSLVAVLSPDVFITEIQTATTTSASEEFVEIYNNTDHDIDFADTAHAKKDIWKLQYFSGSKLAAATGVTDWAQPTGTIDLSTMDNTIIPAHDYYVLAASKSDGSLYQPGSIAADGHYSAKLSDNVGLQLIDVVSATAVTTAHDRVTWQKPLTAAGALLAPQPGTSLQRIANNDGEYVDEANGLTGFQVMTPISPRDMWTPPVAPDNSETDTDDPLNNGDSTVSAQAAEAGLKSPLITELLPNPASPRVDTKDEFIELYNPNESALDLSGYSLETGTTTLHDFTFATGSVLAANSYQAFYSVDTHLSLTNSGGQVRLLAPDKKKISETAPYSTAADGQAWVVIDGVWQWSDTPTPNKANIVSIVSAIHQSMVSKTEKAKAKVKGTNSVKTKTVKAKKAKAVKAKKKKLKQTTAIKPASANLASTIKPTPIHAGVLATIAAAAVLYALYEYRIDLANYFYRLRSHHPFRRNHRR